MLVGSTKEISGSVLSVELGPETGARLNPSRVARADVSGEVGCYGPHGLKLPNVAYPEKIKAIPTDAWKSVEGSGR